jgi:hypothetical protein
VLFRPLTQFTVVAASKLCDPTKAHNQDGGHPDIVTLKQIAPAAPAAPAPPAPASTGEVVCPRCTLSNPSSNSHCGVCNSALRKDSGAGAGAVAHVDLAPPPPPPPSLLPPAMPPSLPHGWSAHFSSEKGKSYYHNSTTGETQWEKPGSTSPPPPPPVAPAQADVTTLVALRDSTNYAGWSKNKGGWDRLTPTMTPSADRGNLGQRDPKFR